MTKFLWLLGRHWNEQTAKRLQVELLKMIDSDPEIQGNNVKFENGAYATHVPAYSYNGTIGHLPYSDLVKIVREPDVKDSWVGRKQIIEMVPKVQPRREGVLNLTLQYAQCQLFTRTLFTKSTR